MLVIPSQNQNHDCKLFILVKSTTSVNACPSCFIFVFRMRALSLKMNGAGKPVQVKRSLQVRMCVVVFVECVPPKQNKKISVILSGNISLLAMGPVRISLHHGGEKVYWLTRANCRRAEKYGGIRWKGQCPYALLQHTEKFWKIFFQTFQVTPWCTCHSHKIATEPSAMQSFCGWSWVASQNGYHWVPWRNAHGPCRDAHPESKLLWLPASRYFLLSAFCAISFSNTEVLFAGIYNATGAIIRGTPLWPWQQQRSLPREHLRSIEHTFIPQFPHAFLFLH